ncbi:hypothetical protein BDV38DRAFT_276755 [Aspergillus pseudotamarii]|uniref:Uncharacterized protein n=1 Tax=Aspergillus pseudotamarii TaxID=132259 RepID=A0A5N6TBL8_ASPPS|nr:uncharacterized protein BDV38DRAFT_276755 [Aspergillus pseudotamarii]KAE8143670.1 hypothetical protein BDV38DRAFT_276755 [Aspergillus pseudotamarii]
MSYNPANNEIGVVVTDFDHVGLQKDINESIKIALEEEIELVTCRSLTSDKFSDAENLYGKRIYAFMVVEGWHIRYMPFLFMVGALCSICAVVVAAGVSQGLEAGLTAGSYELGIATVFLAIMTFLNAVLWLASIAGELTAPIGIISRKAIDRQ